MLCILMLTCGCVGATSNCYSLVTLAQCRHCIQTMRCILLCLLTDRTGDICNACVLLVKRWKKLPRGSKKNWNHVSLIILVNSVLACALPACTDCVQFTCLCLLCIVHWTTLCRCAHFLPFITHLGGRCTSCSWNKS